MTDGSATQGSTLAVVLTGGALAWSVLVYVAAAGSLDPFGGGLGMTVVLSVLGLLGLLGLPAGAWWMHRTEDIRPLVAAGLALVAGWGSLGGSTWLLLFWEAEGRDASAAIIVALERHRADHDALPETLDQLVPSYLGAVPLHPFRGVLTPYTYTVSEDGAACLDVQPIRGNTAYRCHWCSTDRGGLTCWAQ